MVCEGAEICTLKSAREAEVAGCSIESRGQLGLLLCLHV